MFIFAADQADTSLNFDELPWIIRDTDRSILARVRDAHALSALEWLLPDILRALREDPRPGCLRRLPHGFSDTTSLDNVEISASAASSNVRNHMRDQSPQLSVRTHEPRATIGPVLRVDNAYGPNSRQDANPRKRIYAALHFYKRDRISLHTQ